MKRSKFSENYLMVNIIKNKVKMQQGEYICDKDLYTFVGIDILGNRQVGLSKKVLTIHNIII